MHKNRIKITEAQLNRVINESITQVLNEQYAMNEGWKNWAAAGILGAASMFGGSQNAQAQSQYNYQTPDSIVYKNCDNKNDSVMAKKMWDNEDRITNNPLTVKQLAKMFPKAYKDRNASPEVWQKNQNSYCGTDVNGRMSIVGKRAAAYGKNPWDAIVRKYTVANYNSKVGKSNSQ